MTNCIGGPFIPGIETSHFTRDLYPYVEPFRLDWTQRQPGDLTKPLAIPWQADFIDCSYQAPLLWWPAARPDDALPENGGALIPWARHQYLPRYDRKLEQTGIPAELRNQIVEIESEL